MPFVSLNSASGERIDITKTVSPLSSLRASEMVCPICGWPMIVKAGPKITAHFAHKPGRDDCPYAEYARGETQEHRAAKQMVRDEIANWFSDYGIATPALEVYIPDVKYARNRIADILFTFPSGWRIAHEIQLASITIEELRERSEDYLSAGIDVYWWFGRDAAKQSNFEWSLKTYGFILEIQIRQQPGSNFSVLHEAPVHSIHVSAAGQ
jgi:competence protein CoiA